MLNQFSRIEPICGKEAMKKLANSRVAFFDIGGVGGYTVEALQKMNNIRNRISEMVNTKEILPDFYQ